MHSNVEPKFQNKKMGKTLDRRNGELRWRTLEVKSGLRKAVENNHFGQILLYHQQSMMKS
jgi:hypothetical protein